MTGFEFMVMMIIIIMIIIRPESLSLSKERMSLKEIMIPSPHGYTRLDAVILNI